jgi:hypothetical protein
MHRHSTSLRSILIVSFHLCLNLQSVNVNHGRALINNSYKQTNKCTNVKCIFSKHNLSQLRHVSICLDHPERFIEPQWSMYKNIIGMLLNTLKFVHKTSVDILLGHIHALLSLYPVNTDTCTHILFKQHFINTLPNPTCFHP